MSNLRPFLPCFLKIMSGNLKFAPFHKVKIVPKLGKSRTLMGRLTEKQPQNKIPPAPQGKGIKCIGESVTLQWNYVPQNEQMKLAWDSVLVWFLEHCDMSAAVMVWWHLIGHAALVAITGTISWALSLNQVTATHLKTRHQSISTGGIWSSNKLLRHYRPFALRIHCLPVDSHHKGPVMQRLHDRVLG